MSDFFTAIYSKKNTYFREGEIKRTIAQRRGFEFPKAPLEKMPFC